MKIGSLDIDGNVFLAPMADINDLAFRIQCKRYGASLLYTQMINVNALVRNNKSTLNLLKTCDEDSPLAVQLFGTKIDVIKKAIKIVEPYADIIDFNMGCPYKDLVNIGAGAALLKRYNKVAEIVSAMRSSTSLPITIKIRSGFDNNNINALEIAKIIEKNGADAIIIHPRTALQFYSGKADWDIITKIKEQANIPIIGNGDIFSPEDSKKMFETTKCDAIMIGRACIGNPYIFKEINYYLDNEVLLKPLTIDQKIDIFYEYIGLTELYYTKKLSDIRRKALYFTKGFPKAASLRARLSKAQTVEKIKDIFNSYRINKD